MCKHKNIFLSTNTILQNFILLKYFLGIKILGEKTCDASGNLFYEELGCSPNFEESTCPTSYTCPEYKNDPKTCHFQNRIYKIGNQVDTSGTGYNCHIGCICQGGYV